MQKFLPPSPVAALLSTLFLAIIAAIAAAIFGFNPYAQSQPVVPTTDDPIVEEEAAEGSSAVPLSYCESVPEDLVSSCCEAWATENELVQIRCIGDWEIQNEQCTYVCAAE